MYGNKINLESSWEAREYKVLYSKDGAKKRKAFSDGTLVVRKANGGVSNQIVLYSEERTELYKILEKNLSKICVNSEVDIGPFLVQIDEIIYGASSQPIPKPVLQKSAIRPPAMVRQFVTPKPFTIPKPEPLAQLVLLEDKWEREENFVGRKENVNVPHATQQNSKSITGHINESSLLGKVAKMEPTVNAPPIKGPELDPSLTRVMREHQVVGAQFLLSRLQKEEEEGLDDDILCYRREVVRHSGAILADEMGVGKTLTTLAVVWAFARKEICKSVIITPSSLVENWAKEMKHWLGVKLTPLIVKPGADAAALINTFSISRVSRYPVLVLSYEMFRKHANLMNTVTSLELMVCDEGHRLKNIGGTKTIDALNNCKAFRRVVLSGTPIQNDLDELYSVINFVVPGYLGSLSDYKRYIATPITAAADAAASGNAEDSDEEETEVEDLHKHRKGNKQPVHKQSSKAQNAGEEASQQLRTLLGKIMLRRTQKDILHKLLPPRSDYVVYCGLTANQQQDYHIVAGNIKRSLGLDEHSGLYDEAVVHNVGAIPSNVVLPGLQQLRQLCNFAAGDLTKVETEHNWSCGGGSSVGSGNSKATPVLLANSTKLQFISRFLQTLRQVSPDEKVVIVSNFTTVLDKIEQLLNNMGHGGEGRLLRLDGKVPVDLRQNLVNRFNRADDPSSIFLLSSKAGGVGINLIGGSRLIMCDVDWNPAIDHQAMSRVWREGQKRDTHVYRLVTAGCIEEAILQRQRSKNDLAVLVQKNEGGDGGEGDDAAVVDDAEQDLGLASTKGSASNLLALSSEKRMSLTRKDVLLLMHPNLAASSEEARQTRESASERHTGPSYGKNWIARRVLEGNSDESSPDSDFELEKEVMGKVMSGKEGSTAQAEAEVRLDPAVTEEVLVATVNSFSPQAVVRVTKVK